MPFYKGKKLLPVAPQVSAQNPYGLNAGEFNLARVLGRGLDLAETAKTLGTSDRSVRAQVSRLMQKLHARNPAHLEHIIATLGRLEGDWCETVYLDDTSDDLADVEDLIFAD